MEYIKVLPEWDIDYVPIDGKLCMICRFYSICPYDFHCATLRRKEEYEMLDNDDTDQGVE